MERPASVGVSPAALAPRAPAAASTPPSSPARTSATWLPRSPSSGLKRCVTPLIPTPIEGWGKAAWEQEGGQPAIAAAGDAENVAPEAAERSPRAAVSPGGPLRSLSGNELRRVPSAEGKLATCVSPPVANAPAQLATPTAVANALSPASLPAPLTSELPRGARLMRLGLTGRDSSQPSPPKAASSRARGDDENAGARLAAACAAALLTAVILGAALRPRRIDADVSATALVPWNAAVAADQARRLYPVGQMMMLPFAPPQQLHCQWLALAALAPHAAWSHCGTMPAARMVALPALPPSAAAMQPGELALASVAAVSAAARATAEAYGALAELAADFMERNAIEPSDAQALAAVGCALLLVTVFVLLRVIARRRPHDGGDATSEDLEEADDVADDADEAVNDELVTPQSGIAEEYSGYSQSAAYDEADSDVAAPLPEGELRDSWPLVSTPAVTRLLSFSRAASPVGSMRTSIGYGAAVPASALQRRSRRLAGRDATVAGVGLPPPTRGSVQRLRSRQQR